MTEVYNRVIECSELEESEAANSGFDGLVLSGKVLPKEQLNTTPKLTLYVQVKLELGHRATLRLKPTFEGFTHDWEVFLRSPEGAANCALHQFIRRVEFHLHQSFSRQKIVQKEPPFKLNESGYAGFVLPIDVHLRNPGQPKKIRFLYDLFIDPQRSTSHVRCEKITFKNPPAVFRDLLFKGGGQLIRRRVRMNDSGFASFCRNPSSVGSNFSRSFGPKPPPTTAASEGQSRDFGSAATAATDSKDWFRVKRELLDRSDADQDKENFPTDDGRNRRNSQTKSSISFLQDWLRNIRQNKSKNVSSLSSSGINIPGSLKEGGHVTKVWRQGVQRQLAEKAENRLGMETYGAYKTKTINSTDNGMGSDGPIKRGRGRPRKHPHAQFPSGASRKAASSMGTGRFPVPKTFDPSDLSEFQAGNSGSQKRKTNPDNLYSITRRRFLKTNGNESPAYTFAPRCNTNEIYRESLAKHSKSNSGDIDSKSEYSSNWSRGATSPAPVKRRGRGRPRKNPLVEAHRWPTAERTQDPNRGNRSETATRSACYNYYPRDNFGGNVPRHHPQDIRRNSGSDNDDVIITGYSPPRKQLSYGVPSDGVEWRSGVGQTETKVKRKRSTQLQLLRSAADKFAGASKIETTPYGYSDENMTSSVKNVDLCPASTSRLSKLEEGRGRERTHSFKYDSEEEESNTKGTSASDMSAEYLQPAAHGSPVFSRTGNHGRRNNGSTSDDRKWLTSTPVGHRRKSVLPRRSGSLAANNRRKRSHRNDDDDRAWNRCTHNDRSPWSRRKLTKRPAKATTTAPYHGRRRRPNFPPPPGDSDGPCFYPEPPAATSVTPQSLPLPLPGGISEEVTVSGEPVAVLMELQQRLATLSDPVMLRRVVEIVEDSGKYRLDDAMFDFDLCNLDRNTVNRLYDCLRSSSSVP